MEQKTPSNPFEPFVQSGSTFAEEEFTQFEQLQAASPQLALYYSLPANEQNEAFQLASNLNHQDYEAILSFGKQAQEKLADFTSYMLKQTRAQDTTRTATLLNDLFQHIEQISVDTFVQKEPTFLERLFHKKQPSIQEAISNYTRLKVRIDRVSIQLEHSQLQLMKEYEMLNDLYQINEDYFHYINTYIAACEWKLNDLRELHLPAIIKKASETGHVLDEQAMRDLHMQIEWIDKRKYDLEISREIAIQSAPQIRMIQQTGQLLMEKIQSSILNTIPIWQSQIAMILQMNKQRRLAQTEQRMIKASNTLSEKNRALFEATKTKTNEQLQATSFDLEQFKQTQTQLLKDIEETILIQQQANKMLD